MNLNDFDYDLPESFIAQTPVEPRDSSRLMLLNRFTGDIQHRIFRDITDLLRPGDVLVVNDTRVIPARLHATKVNTVGKIEILLLQQLDETHWHVLAGGRQVKKGLTLKFAGADVTATVTEVLEGSERVLMFSQPVNDLLEQLGEAPLPPYIHTRLDNAERYQTVYSREKGSAAAPTAGLHFTPELLVALRDQGVRMAYCTLHVGLDTFQPVRVQEIEKHHIHRERALLTADNAKIINEAKLSGGRIIAVGTTTARTLETAAILSAGGDPAHPADLATCPWRPVIAFHRDTDLYIYPGFRWRAVDCLITNFHLPKSTLLMMISSLAGRENVLRAYETAKAEGYRFFSFGDAMFIGDA
jgi:S-adenosylmethionine:tRNA ribosyltransferase-isomerase